MTSRVLIELLRGKGAHVDPLACVEDLSAQLASHRIEGFPHSIGQLVFHMNYWMDYDLRRIAGERPPYPAHNSESFPSKPSPANAGEWDGLTKRFAALINHSAALADSAPEELKRHIEPTHPSHKERRLHSKPFCGNWSRITAITSARSRCYDALSAPGRHAVAEIRGRNPSLVVSRSRTRLDRTFKLG